MSGMTTPPPKPYAQCANDRCLVLYEQPFVTLGLLTERNININYTWDKIKIVKTISNIYKIILCSEVALSRHFCIYENYYQFIR